MENVQYKNLVIKSTEVDEDKRIFKAVISSSDVDLADEVLLPSGCVKKDFLGTILFNHNPNMPIGKSLQINRQGNQLIATGQLAEAGTDGEIDKIWSLMKQGIIRGISVGFRVLKDGRRTPSRKDIQDFGKDVRSIITRWKLIEFSVTPIPCNQAATVIAMKSLNLDPRDYGIEVEEAPEIVIEENIEVIKEDAKQFDTLVAKIKKEIEAEQFIEQEKEMVKETIKEQIIKSKLLRNGNIYY